MVDENFINCRDCGPRLGVQIVPRGTHFLKGVPLFGVNRASAPEGFLEVPKSVVDVREISVLEFLANYLPDGGVFVDVGAHAGFYSVPLARKFQQVWSFEPSPMQSGLLRANVDLNKLGNVQIVESALGARDEVANLHIMGNSGGSNSLRDPGLESPPMASIEVGVKTLDSYHLSDIRLLKIDVEGWELEVLAGAKKAIQSSRPLLVVESEERDRNQNELKSFFRGLSYSWTRPFECCPELFLAESSRLAL